uniref:Integrase n=1 Tax=Streptomyces sp. NBC_00003 TaxID=2903608 RepID=A0AAU2VH03_9ACTN
MAAVSAFLHHMLADDASPTPLRSYAYELLAWVRFLHAVDVPWHLASRVEDLVASHATAEGRKILHRYATWHLLRRLRRRSRGKETTYYQVKVARQHLRAGVYLLDWLEGQNLALATCRQTDLERWMTSEDARLRQEAGHFVRWALAQKIARDLSFPAERWNGPSQPMDDEARWATARRLLHDDTLKPQDRLAGLLLLLYAQWPAAISRLTVDHIEKTDAGVRIRLGAVPVELPELVAELALQQVEVRRSHAALARTDSSWLFPGGQPGRPISSWAMGERLHELGIRLAEARSTALFQLATELPAAVLARTLGIDITSPSNGREPPPATGAPMRPRSAAETRKPDPSRCQTPLTCCFS